LLGICWNICQAVPVGNRFFTAPKPSSDVTLWSSPAQRSMPIGNISQDQIPAPPPRRSGGNRRRDEDHIAPQWPACRDVGCYQTTRDRSADRRRYALVDIVPAHEPWRRKTANAASRSVRSLRHDARVAQYSNITQYNTIWWPWVDRRVVTLTTLTSSNGSATTTPVASIRCRSDLASAASRPTSHRQDVACKQRNARCLDPPVYRWPSHHHAESR
jgi:hypothetical protein